MLESKKKISSFAVERQNFDKIVKLLYYYSMNEDFERGDRVILLDRPMGHPSKIQGVIVGIVGEDCYNILLTNNF